MKTKIFLTLYCFALLHMASARAQAPSFEWVKSAGGTNVGPSYNNDNATSLAMDSSGDVFISGIFESASMTLGTVHLDNPLYDPSIGEGAASIFIAKYSPSGDCIWAKVFGVAINQIYSSCPVIAADASGDVYIAGVYGGLDGNAIFGSVTVKGTGIFLVKLDPNGTPLWGKSDDGITAGNGYNDAATCIATDAQGNVYLGGEFFAPKVTFGSTTLKDADTLGISSDIILIKYDPSGNALWAKSAGGSASDAPTSITTDNTGNLYLAGLSLSPSITFGSTTLNSPAGHGCSWLVKYSQSSDVLWGRSAGKASGDNIMSTATDPTGVYITGQFGSDTIQFGSTAPIVNKSFGAPKIFVAKYNPSGDALWSTSPDGTSFIGDYATSIVAGPSGTVDITGYFSSKSLTFGTTTITSTGSDAIFVAQYDAAGNAHWAKSPQGQGLVSANYAFGTTSDKHGAIYIAGGFTSSSIAFDQINVANTDSAASPYNLFLAKIAAPSTNTVSNAALPVSGRMICSPDPVKDNLSVIYTSESDGPAILTISDILGRERLRQEFRETGATNEEIINVANIPEGIYYCYLRSAHTIATAKIIVKH